MSSTALAEDYRQLAHEAMAEARRANKEQLEKSAADQSLIKSAADALVANEFLDASHRGAWVADVQARGMDAALSVIVKMAQQAMPRPIYSLEDGHAIAPQREDPTERSVWRSAMDKATRLKS